MSAHPYASLCDACGHLASRHLLAPEGDLQAGPYRCQHCDCATTQDGPFTPISKQQYQRIPKDLTWEALEPAEPSRWGRFA